MNISRMFNHLFSSNKNLENNQTIQNKKNDNSENVLNIKQVTLNNVAATGKDADSALKSLKEQIKKEQNPHQFDAGRIHALLNGEKTSRLDSYRTEVLKNVVGEQNQAALVQSNTVNQMKKLLTGKSA